MSDKIEVRKLSLKKGDILVIQRNYCTNANWVEMLADLTESGRAAGIDFNVPIVLVDNIDDIAVLRKEE